VAEGDLGAAGDSQVTVTDLVLDRSVETGEPVPQAVLAGFFLIECESMERAIAYAARVPEAALGLVEVRPVMDLRGFEM